MREISGKHTTFLFLYRYPNDLQYPRRAMSEHIWETGGPLIPKDKNLQHKVYIRSRYPCIMLLSAIWSLVTEISGQPVVSIIRSELTIKDFWTACPLKWDRQAVPKRLQTTTNLLCGSSKKAAEECNQVYPAVLLKTKSVLCWLNFALFI